MALHTFKVSIITPSTIGAGAAAAVIRAAAAPGGGARPAITRIAAMVHASPTSQTYLDVYRVPVGNIGTPTTSVLGQGVLSAADISVTNVDTAWSGNPTLPSPAIRLDGWSGAGTIGAGYVFSFGDGFTLEPNTGLLLWCPSAAGQLRITPEWTE